MNMEDLILNFILQGTRRDLVLTKVKFFSSESVYLDFAEINTSIY